jgi:hypothetical protein
MKTDLKFRQKAKVGVAGSFFNQIMSNNASLPEVGKGATVLHYTDRTCYEVIEVSKDYKTVKLEALEARYNDQIHKNGSAPMGHQDWILEPTDRFITIVWKWGSWKTKHKVVRFTKEFEALARNLNDEQRNAVYGNDVRPQNVVKGITEETFEYSTIKLIFGRKDYYYDWSF